MFGNFCKKIANFVMMGQKNMVTDDKHQVMEKGSHSIAFGQVS
jgi:hypothetical protein